MKTKLVAATQQRPPVPRKRWRFREVRSIAYQAISAWLDHDAASMGAALAFYTLFSIAPILVIALAVAGYVFGPQVAETHVLAQMRELLGDAGAKAVQGLLASAHQSGQKGFAAAIGVVTLLVGATSVFGELQNT